MAYEPYPVVDSAGVAVWSAKVAGDSNNRMEISADGVVSWGGGSGAVDVVMSRGGADLLELASGDSFQTVSGHLRAGGAGGTGDAYLDLDDGSSVTAGGAGEVRFRSNGGTFEISENGAAFAAPGGGGSLDDAYDFGGAHLGRTVQIDGGFPIEFKLDTGTVPALSSLTALVLFNASSNVGLSLISGTTRNCVINFGDTDAEARAIIDYDNNIDLWTHRIAGVQLLSIDLAGSVFNEGAQAGVDFRVESVNSTNMLFVDAGADRVVMQKDNGSLPAISADTALVISNTSVVGDNVEMSLISGTSGVVTLNLGDSADEDRCHIDMTATGQLLSFTVGGIEFLRFDGSNGPLIINDDGTSVVDLRVEGESLQRLLATDASAATENVIFLTDTAPNFQTGDRIVYWGSVSTEPTAAPAGGAFMYVDVLGNLQELNEAAEIGELAVAERREWWWQVNANDTTAEAVGMTAPTVTGSALANDGATGPFIQYDTTTTINLDAGWNGAANGMRTDWGPVMTACIATDAAITDVRIWVGMFSADPMGAADPTLHLAAFRYDTAADGTAFWRCVTEDGTTINVTTTTIAIAVDTVYNLRIDARDSASIKFYINGVLAATHTTNLPTSTTDLDAYAELRNLAAASKFFNLNKVHMATK